MLFIVKNKLGRGEKYLLLCNTVMSEVKILSSSPEKNLC